MDFFAAGFIVAKHESKWDELLLASCSCSANLNHFFPAGFKTLCFQVNFSPEAAQQEEGLWEDEVILTEYCEKHKIPQNFIQARDEIGKVRITHKGNVLYYKINM